MKKLGRSHQPFFRICAVDKRAPRDGRVLEELGTYDPRVPETDARAILKAERVDYWLGVGAQPSENVAVLIKKYGTNGTHARRAEGGAGKTRAAEVGARSGRAGQLAEAKEDKGRNRCRSGSCCRSCGAEG